MTDHTEYTLDEVMALLYAERQKYPSMRAMAKAWGMSHEAVARVFRLKAIGDGAVVLERLGLKRVTDSTARYISR
jgi:transcriptional regulator of aromatic amino acid metabolism